MEKLGDAFICLCVYLYVSRIAWVSGHGEAVVLIWVTGFLLNVAQQYGRRER